MGAERENEPENNTKRVIRRGNQLHEMDFIKLGDVKSKCDFVSNWRADTESHKTIVAQLL
jgi:hypothetical protein